MKENIRQELYTAKIHLDRAECMIGNAVGLPTEFLEDLSSAKGCLTDCIISLKKKKKYKFLYFCHSSSKWIETSKYFENEMSFRNFNPPSWREGDVCYQMNHKWIEE